MVIKVYSTFVISAELEPHLQVPFSVIHKTCVFPGVSVRLQGIETADSKSNRYDSFANGVYTSGLSIFFKTNFLS